MQTLEHPAIEKMNRHGYLGTLEEEENSVEHCENCDVVLTRGDEVVDFHEHIFCNKECMMGAFIESPETYGMELRKLD